MPLSTDNLDPATLNLQSPAERIAEEARCSAMPDAFRFTVVVSSVSLLVKSLDFRVRQVVLSLARSHEAVLRCCDVPLGVYYVSL